MGDTACVRRISWAGGALGNTVAQLSVAYFGALALNDSTARTRIRAKFPTVSPGRPARVPFRAYLDHGFSGAEAQVFVDDELARVVTTSQRNGANLRAAAVAQARGRPKLAAEHYRAVTALIENPNEFFYAPTVPSLLALNAALFGGDSIAGAEGAREVDSLIALPGPTAGAHHRTRLLLSFVSAEYHLARGNREVARQAIRQLRAFVPPPDSTWLRRYFDRPAALLEAQLAVDERRSDAALYVQRVDSMLLDPVGTDRFALLGNPVAARVWEALGDHRRALAAIRRREFDRLINPYIAIYLRDEGRLAARTGDRAGSIRAYRHYLALRNEPEPSVVPEVESVRADLAQLAREAARR